MSSETTKAEHTPGPWKPLYSNSTGEVFVAPVAEDNTVEGNPVATLDELNMSREELGANARLIAAAPELLAALKGALAYIREACAEELREAEDVAWTFRQAEALIAKAEGRS